MQHSDIFAYLFRHLTTCTRLNTRFLRLIHTGNIRIWLTTNNVWRGEDEKWASCVDARERCSASRLSDIFKGGRLRQMYQPNILVPIIYL